MNPQIQELLIQVVGPSRLHGGEFALFGDQQVEQFAELIVQECMDICKKHPSRDLENGWFADAVAPHLVQLFEEHFGVEE